jgi:flagellar biosynthesis/type III secretory pathway protein FliH
MKRIVARMVFGTALILAMGVGLTGSAFAQYGYYDEFYDRGSARQAHRYGYQNGYHDGYRKGRHEGREHDPGDIDVRALNEATQGYRRWMGPVEPFRDGYRSGYRRGFRAGYQDVNRGWRDRDYDDRYRW